MNHCGDHHSERFFGGKRSQNTPRVAFFDSRFFSASMYVIVQPWNETLERTGRARSLWPNIAKAIIWSRFNCRGNAGTSCRRVTVLDGNNMAKYTWINILVKNTASDKQEICIRLTERISLMRSREKNIWVKGPLVFPSRSLLRRIFDASNKVACLKPKRYLHYQMVSWLCTPWLSAEMYCVNLVAHSLCKVSYVFFERWWTRSIFLAALLVNYIQTERYKWKSGQRIHPDSVPP